MTFSSLVPAAEQLSLPVIAKLLNAAGCLQVDTDSSGFTSLNPHRWCWSTADDEFVFLFPPCLVQEQRSWSDDVYFELTVLGDQLVDARLIDAVVEHPVLPVRQDRLPLRSANEFLDFVTDLWA